MKMKIILLATLAIVLKLDYARAYSISLPNDCEHFATWRVITPYKAHDAITDLVAIYKAPIAEHWYLSALIDEYVKEARTAILETSTNYCATLKNSDDLFYWRSLHTCEQYLIRYQQIVNLLGHNLQCAVSSALRTAPTFFLSSMPMIDGRAGPGFGKYVEMYYELGMKIETIKELERQPKCVGRMVNEGGKKSVTALNREPMTRIENLLSKLFIVDVTGAKRSIMADLAEASNVVEKVEDEATKLIEGYVETMRAGQEWNDCHVIAHDLDEFHKENNQMDKLLLAFEFDRNGRNCISANADQIIAMIPAMFIKLATSTYRNAIKRLGLNYLQPHGSIGFIQEADDILESMFVLEFKPQMDRWQMAIDGYQTAKRKNFIGECTKLREHIATVPQTVANTERKLREIFKQNGVYLPIVIVGRHKFNPKHAADLIAEYSEQFSTQFEGTKLNIDSQAKAHEMKAHSRFRKYFWFDEIYSKSYDQFLATSVTTVKANIVKLNASTEWAEYYSALNDFVDGLNKYGRDSFELIHRNA